MEAPPVAVEWRRLPSASNATGYEASTKGKIRNLKTGNTLDPSPSKQNGYIYVRIRDDSGRERQIGAHILVAHAYSPDPPNEEVDHINRNRTDNRPDNLRWVTRLGNAQNQSTPSARSVKRVEQRDYDGNVIKVWDSALEAGTTLGINVRSIRNACGGNPNHRSNGFAWYYVAEGARDADTGELRQMKVNGRAMTISSKGWVQLKGHDPTFGHLGNGKYLVHVKTRDGRSASKYRVASLVCEAFHGPRLSPESVVRHLDRDMLNNSSDNLQWSTMVEVLMDRPKAKSGTRGKAVHQLEDDQIIVTYASLAIAARATGVDQANIGACCRGRVPKAGGYVWKYASDTMKRIPAPEEPVDE
jgi:hypothetical protein